MEKKIELGLLSEKFKTLWIIIFIFVCLIILGAGGYYRWIDSSASCITCHSDKAKMDKEGWPYFYITQQQVELETKHTAIQCRDCHLGNGRSKTAEKAHKGMLKLLIIGENGKNLPRKKYYKAPLLPTGENQMYALLPKEKDNGELTP
jgi:hypothetical protein